MNHSLLDLAEVSILTAGKWSVGSDWHFKNRKIEAWQMYVVLSGKARFDVQGQNFSAQKGDVVLLSPQFTYSSDCAGNILTDPFTHLSLHFTCTITGGIDVMPALALPTHHQKIPFQWAQLLAMDFPEIGRATLGGKSIALLKWWLQSLQAKPELGTELSPKLTLILRFQEIVSQNLAEPIDVAELAEKLSVTPRRLAKEVKQFSGKRPVEWIRQLKIEHAKSLLRTGRSVTETAQRTGFADIFYFSRVFSQVSGNSPTAYLRASELAKEEH